MIKTPQHGLYKISVSSKSQISLIFSYNFETDLRLKELFVDGLQKMKHCSRGNGMVELLRLELKKMEIY